MDHNLKLKTFSIRLGKPAEVALLPFHMIVGTYRAAIKTPDRMVIRQCRQFFAQQCRLVRRELLKETGAKQLRLGLPVKLAEGLIGEGDGAIQ